MHFLLLVIQLLLLFPQYALGGFCSFAAIRYSSSAASRTVYYAERYSVSCGAFGWSSCTRYRHRSRPEYYQEIHSHYVTDYKCCMGWSGAECDIHDQVPSVVTCPEDFEVQAEGPDANVSWVEPTFEEPYNYDLTIHSTHQNQATLPWGPTTVTYTATSTNNNKQATCAFVVFVKPPLDHASVPGYTSTSTAHVEEGIAENLQCRADYGSPPFQLQWTLMGTPLQNQSYHTEATSLEGYENAVNDMYFVPNRKHDGKILVCEAIKPNRTMEQIQITLNVTYDPDPVVEYCPDNRSVESSERVMELAVELAEFSDVNDDPLTMTCSVLSLQEFLLGDYDIQCVAENQRTHRTNSCQYTLSVKPPACLPPQAPENGALLCGIYNQSVVHICQPTCLSGYDVTFDAVAPSLFICTLDGEWFPKLPQFSCSESSLNQMAHNMPSSAHYLRSDVSCVEAADDEATMRAFSSTVRSSPYSSVCAHNNCEPLALRVHCED